MTLDLTTARNALPATIASARLTLRAPQRGDLHDLVRLANNPKIIGQTATLPQPYLEAHGIGFIERFAHKPERRPYAIVDGTDAFMGVTGLTFSSEQPPELGYWLGEPFWGHGYVAEAVTALLAAAQQTGLIPTVMARVLADNTQSVRVLEKCGFSLAERTTSNVERHLGRPLLIMRWGR